jgi:hypothetical protein
MDAYKKDVDYDILQSTTLVPCFLSKKECGDQERKGIVLVGSTKVVADKEHMGDRENPPLV